MQRRYTRRIRPFSFATLGLIALGVVSARAAQSQELATVDGPYVVQQRDGTLRALFTDAANGTPARTVRTGDDIDIPAVGKVPSFRVKLRPAAADAPSAYTTTPDAPLFIVADTHGEYEILVELLQKHRIIDAALRWSFRKGHLVFLGDVFDRGPNQTEILWLIYKLEAEAKQARGGVHLVLGNHEYMLMTGDVRYLNSKYVRTARTLGVDSYANLFAANTVLGQWLRTKPAVIKLNDLLCLHGGISHEVIERKLSLQQINSVIRSALRNEAQDDPAAEFLLEKMGPLWYRGYFAHAAEWPTASPAEVNDVLEYFDISRILVGHTIVPTITALYDGKVIAVQVYPHRDQKNGKAVMEALRVERGRFYRSRIDGGTEALQ
jgi:hypothetical protein